METVKRGFVFYFDNFCAVNHLPLEQRGLLFTALGDYADRVWRDPNTDVEGVLAGYPQLSPEAGSVCRLLAVSVLRDTQKWLRQQESRQQFRQQRMQQRREAAPAARPDSPEALAAYQKDLERARRILREDQEE